MKSGEEGKYGKKIYVSTVTGANGSGCISPIFESGAIPNIREYSLIGVTPFHRLLNQTAEYRSGAVPLRTAPEPNAT